MKQSTTGGSSASQINDSYFLKIEKPGTIFSGTRKDLKSAVQEMHQLGLMPAEGVI